jgi:hypothetical protein
MGIAILNRNTKYDSMHKIFAIQKHLYLTLNKFNDNSKRLILIKK